MDRIRVAIAGVGNCASALVQGVAYYSFDLSGRSDRAEGTDATNGLAAAASFGEATKRATGLMRSDIGGFGPQAIEFVAAFDVDDRKVGKPLEEAVFAPPNCAVVFQEELPASGVTVARGPVLDGVAAHMKDHPADRAFRVSTDEDSTARVVDVAAMLIQSRAEVLVCYLPVGSEDAVRHYAEACLSAGVAFVNCVPVFIASDPRYAKRFEERGLPIVGDDIKSQVGATILHRALARLFADRGVELDRTYQLNTGGNTDFLNMLEQSRLASKKQSKTESVQSQLDERLATEDIHIGPSDYVAWQRDNKVAFIRAEGRGFGGVPLELELRLSVQDSPNSAGVVIDAIRCAKLGLDRGLGGALDFASAYYMKSPPRQMRDDEARRGLEEFIDAKTLATTT